MIKMYTPIFREEPNKTDKKIIKLCFKVIANQYKLIQKVIVIQRNSL